jgi:hypothetical protein
VSELKHAGSFHDLVVYQKARELQREIFLVSQAFPRDEKFSLTDQDPSFVSLDRSKPG